MVQFLDSNIPMYAVGAAHPLKAPALAVMRALAARPGDFVTSVEVLQEIIHRYQAQHRWSASGRAAFNDFATLMRGRVEPVLEEDAWTAAELADANRGADSRDLFHAAVMRRLGIVEIVSTDSGFDSIVHVSRIDPRVWTPSG